MHRIIYDVRIIIRAENMNNVLIVLTVILASVLTQWVSLTQGNRYIGAVSSKEKIRNK